MENPTRIDWTTVGSYESLPRAELARFAVEVEGIPTCLENAELVAMAWHYANAVGHVRLLVPRSEAARAIAVLGRGDEPLPFVCPGCDSTLSADDPRCEGCGWDWGGDGSVFDEDEHGAWFLERVPSWRRLWLGWIDVYPNVAFIAIVGLVALIVVGANALSHLAEASIVALATVLMFLAAMWVSNRLREPDAEPTRTWTVGQTVWVVDPDEVWSGTIERMGEGTVSVRASDGRVYDDIDFEVLQHERPQHVQHPEGST